MITTKDNITQIIETNGYVIVKNILSANEIKRLRETVRNYFLLQGVPFASGLTQPNAAVQVPDVNWIFYHPKILAVMSELLGQNNIMFTSHCDIHSRTLSAWHKDDGLTVMEGGYFGYPTYNEEACKVYKVAIYLQDHDNNKGGLTVRKGSHELPKIDDGEEFYIPTKAGDIIVFDVRLTHTGQRDIIPYPSWQKPNQLLQKALNKIFKIPPDQSKKHLKNIYDKLFGERLSIFFTYGLPNEYTKSFAMNNMKRQLEQSKNTNIFLSPESRQQFINNNVILAEDYFSDLVNET
ncbi:phytanoyl-CoA dioxygenase family protein [Crocosphaera sp. UHCC 0190]|uniref:phytanoyl-CoA dioxygenase family protein n=1 Tax=Crocosphaera sp. UHCC 0190 TaxID=3110246 RepID=UPI002B1F4483|nr:phytanoyl-CoA dioxygenase family protein [Crocosphaera sp. UHCC 0190]MEA5509368.1 phytanoyl-CoA dioxygenase family protein [Crocosphaera sp. UHCC 0190]